MNLQALRRYAIKNSVRVRFAVAEGVECLVNEQGVLKIPALRSAPDFNVEASLGAVERFVLETAPDPPKQKKISRAELEALVGGEAPKAEAARDE